MNLTEAIIKSQIEHGLTIQSFIDREFIQKIEIPDEEVRSFYDKNLDQFRQPEQVRASHILIKSDPKDDQQKKAASRKQAEDIREKLNKGEDFAKLAEKYSQGPTSVNGGDLGFFGRGKMVKAFEEVAFAMKPGEISDIVETQFGYHIIKVTDRKAETVLQYDTVRDRLREVLTQNKANEKIGAYINELKKKADVKIF